MGAPDLNHHGPARLGDASRFAKRDDHVVGDVTPLKSDALLRLLVCDLVGEDITRETLATLRDDVADLHRRLEDSERRARAPPHRERYLLLAIEFLRSFLDLHVEFVENVERELAPSRKRSRQTAVLRPTDSKAK